MTTINNDREFQHTLSQLNPGQQRAVAARFVQRVLPLCEDPRIMGALTVASDPTASAADLKTAFHLAREVAVENHTRCGAECDWTAQAGYFVARAAVAAVSDAEPGSSGNAWQAAVNSRMAQTSRSIDAPETDVSGESAAQHQILNEFMQGQTSHATPAEPVP